MNPLYTLETFSISCTVIVLCHASYGSQILSQFQMFRREDGYTSQLPHIFFYGSHPDVFSLGKKGKAVPLQAWSGPEGS